MVVIYTYISTAPSNPDNLAGCSMCTEIDLSTPSVNSPLTGKLSRQLAANVNKRPPTRTCRPGTLSASKQHVATGCCYVVGLAKLKAKVIFIYTIYIFEMGTSIYNSYF